MNKSDHLDWVEQAAKENIRFHISGADYLSKESTTTLTVLLLALGGFGTLLRGLDITQPVGAATLALLIYLSLLAFLLVMKCMRVGEIDAPTNEPKNLYHPDASLDRIREIELDNLQQRIDQVASRNGETTLWLNRVRLLAVAFPLFWALAFGLSLSLVYLVGAAG